MTSPQYGAASSRKLGLIQSSEEAIVDIQAMAGVWDQLLRCRLFFNPAADCIAVVNRNHTKPVTATGLTAEEVNGYAAQPYVNLVPSATAHLESGPWALRTTAGRHILQLTVLPRRAYQIDGPPGGGYIEFQPASDTAAGASALRRGTDSRADGSVGRGLCNPLDELCAGDVARITSPWGE